LVTTVGECLLTDYNYIVLGGNFMSISTVYQDEYLHIFVENGNVSMQTFKPGFPGNKLAGIISSHPEINITNINALIKAINSTPGETVVFGELKDRIVIDISSDGLKATVAFNLPAEELDAGNRKKLIEEVKPLLEKKGITFGIKSELFEKNLVPGKRYTIAEGIPPQDGKDCEIHMYELSEAVPKVSDDGKVNYCELKLINMVKTGDWLGERIEATEGAPGVSVRNEILQQRKGKNLPLLYDKATVKEILENGKTVLYSKVNGAVTYENGKISVSNHLEINGNVDVSTGNIKFDGYVTIKGTVSDGFMVEATKDIEINGDLGIGNIKGITSTEGSIYIKGGVAAKNEAKIFAGKNIYTKFLDNVVALCNGAVHIGFYSKDSYINAREVIFDSLKGHVIGGHIKAVFKISVPITGSEIERKTCLEVTGFDRHKLVAQFESTLIKIEELKKEKQELKQKLASHDDSERMDAFLRKSYTNTMEKFYEASESIKNLEEERKSLAGLLKTRGEGEISITKKAFPNCTFIIKDRTIHITETTLPVIYFIQGNELRQI
jgi:uncharacterized protein (DUF342 family)